MTLPLVFSLEISLIFINDGELWISLVMGNEVVLTVFGVVGFKVVTISYLNKNLFKSTKINHEINTLRTVSVFCSFCPRLAYEFSKYSIPNDISRRNLIAFSRDICEHIQMDISDCKTTSSVQYCKIQTTCRIKNLTYHYQSFLNKFFNRSCNTLFVTCPKNILCHFKAGVLSVVVSQEIFSILDKWIEKYFLFLKSW